MAGYGLEVLNGSDIVFVRAEEKGLIILHTQHAEYNTTGSVELEFPSSVRSAQAMAYVSGTVPGLGTPRTELGWVNTPHVVTIGRINDTNKWRLSWYLWNSPLTGMNFAGPSEIMVVTGA